MKTDEENIVKAVNVLRAGSARVCFFTDSVNASVFKDPVCDAYGVYDDSEIKRLDKICTIKEFNALVAEMETNFGKSTPEDYFTWIALKDNASKATKLEVSKVDIDWSEAPEGATHAAIYKENELNYWYKAVQGKVMSWDFTHWGSTCFNYHDFINNAACNYVITPRPTEPQPPVYTQEMLDNGELPSVGMECRVDSSKNSIKGFEGLVVKIIGVNIDLDGDEVFTFQHSTSGLGCSTIHGLEPLPPKQELIDGKAYSATHKGNGKTFDVIYKKSTDTLHTNGLDHKASFFTNITLLTPEEK